MSGWWGLALGTAAVAAAELDTTMFFQIMIARPVVLGPLLGLALGDVATGALTGLIIEVLSHDKLPVGGQIPANAAISAGAAFLFAIAPAAVPLPLAIPLGLIMGRLHERLVDSPLRRRRAWAPRAAAAALERGEEPPFAAMMAREAGWQFLANAALLAAALCLVKSCYAFLAAPAIWRTAAGSALRFALATAPWAGAGMLAHSLRVNR